ncbi:TatD family hydrolase [Luteolibacter sp. GHJ8]|uniref:TatD family hydrolase n=1 Tax=Luteolibacter rhizosphaerae TaxID=2989719 RepID=A0ABT3G7X7_9BACT|nr:TatD family hydrolase [Luteolibacter rhizosphaerae]MCW1915958.1 TatD family hydrolase [Luteolibacter rhizosphaerae]
MITDSHCHLASHKFSTAEVPELIARAQAAGVTKMVSLVTGLDDLDANLAIAAAHPEVSVCIGIHPCEVHEAPDDAVEQLRPHAADPRVCGIGETGLDYYHPAPEGWETEAYRQRQRDFLEQHFQLAAECGLNVVIHTRDSSGDASFQDALAIYKRHAGQVRAVFHCFIGPEANAREVIALGGLVSFGGVATFKNAADVLATALALPAESFMLETDSPYLAPMPHRGKRNEPAYVRHVAEHLASHRGVDLEQLAVETSATARKFFRFRD